MVMVQPFSSCLVVIVRPSAPVEVDVALCRDLSDGPELDETLTEELDEDDDRALAEAEAALAEPRPEALSARERVSEPSRAIFIISQSSSPELRISPAGAAPAVVARAAPAAMRGNERFMSLSGCAKGRGR